MLKIKGLDGIGRAGGSLRVEVACMVFAAWPMHDVFPSQMPPIFNHNLHLSTDFDRGVPI